ncbi:MAG: 1-acyl-sn-glycerol-3-phosphate acyltransferase [Clostridia bacterium]|nr:1-acyl-sn-glycerol-3-phosphate acyltransferase [Clostridia bacterium]
MLSVYTVAAAAAVLILDRFLPVMRQSYSFWLVPLVFIGFLLGFIIIHLALFIICGYAVNIKKPVGKSGAFYREFVRLTLPMLFTFTRIRVQSTGLELADEVYPALLVCNHFNYIDPAVILKELPDMNLGFIGKKEIYTELPFVAKYMHKLHCLPIDRENNREAAKTIIEAVRLIKSQTVSVGVFPEGYTSLDGELHDFRNGAFKIAIRAGCPIVVCTLLGTDEAMKHIFRKKSTVYFDVLEVIPAEEVAGMSTSELAERIHKEMQENLDKRRSEVCIKK